MTPGPLLSQGSWGENMAKAGYVDIMASQRNGTLYIGVTSDLPGRVYQHRTGVIKGFTKKYGCKLLVCYQAYETSTPPAYASCK
jgi:predicted GIY-YIG superfamily endonuclease